MTFTGRPVGEGNGDEQAGSTYFNLCTWSNLLPHISHAKDVGFGDTSPCDGGREWSPGEASR